LAIFASEEKYDAVVQVVNIDGVMCFQLASGKRGFVERNSSGDIDVWVGADLISVMEADIFELLMDRNRNIHSDYKMLDDMIRTTESVRGTLLLTSMKTAIQKILAQEESQALAEGMKGSTVVGDEEYIYAKGIRMVHHLN
jgi:hypothetical protein